VLFVFGESMDRLGEFFPHPFYIIDMGSIDDAPKDLQHWSSRSLKNLTRASVVGGEENALLMSTGIDGIVEEATKALKKLGCIRMYTVIL
ncbi:hypothetical protein Tco_0588830, partial [Tanacetum coccineum]